MRVVGQGSPVGVHEPCESRRVRPIGVPVNSQSQYGSRFLNLTEVVPILRP